MRALLHGDPVVSIVMDDDAWTVAKAAGKLDRTALLTPGCLLPGRPWAGLQQFRHPPDAASACTAHPPESPEHLEAQAAVAAAAVVAGWRALVEEAGPGRKADVLAVHGATRIALEVQWSQQTADRYAERQAACRGAGVHGVWFARHLLTFASTRELPGSADRPRPTKARWRRTPSASSAAR